MAGRKAAPAAAAVAGGAPAGAAPRRPQRQRRRRRRCRCSCGRRGSASAAAPAPSSGEGAAAVGGALVVQTVGPCLSRTHASALQTSKRPALGATRGPHSPYQSAASPFFWPQTLLKHNPP